MTVDKPPHGGEYTKVEQIDILSQIEHAECVPAAMTLDAVYENFRQHGREFAGVVDGKRLMGIVSRGYVGFLLGARYGFSIYGRRAVGQHMMPEALVVKRDLIEFSSIIRESAMDSAKIISQLLQLSRPCSAERTVCDLTAVVEDSLAILRLKMRAIGAQLDWTPPAEPKAVLADVSQLKQVIINLVLNAVDAMEQSARRSLHIAIQQAGERIFLILEDSGHGIRQQNLSRVFDPFFTTKGPKRGTGLGLSVCLSIVRQHGGDIQVDSTEGIGTTFRITLPASDLPVTVALEAGIIRLNDYQLINGAAEPNAGRLQALVVDDESYITGLVQEALRARMGLIVQRVSTSRDALEHLAERVYDLVISDIRMPGFDGFELYAWICKHRPELRDKFLFITGDAGSAELDGRVEALGAPVLRKPFSIEDLLMHCMRILEKKPVAACAG